MISHTLTFDSIQTKNGVDGWDFDADNETWTVASDVVVFSETAFGFGSGGFANNVLINAGKIYTAAEAAAVHLDDGNGTVFNRADADIFGARNGIDFLGNGSQILNNSGSIVGADNNGVFFDHPTTSVLVNNHGYIFGGIFGVEIASQVVGGVIHNFHIIKSDD